MKSGQEQWVTVPPPFIYYLVMSLIVTVSIQATSTSSLAGSAFKNKPRALPVGVGQLLA